MPLQKRPTLTGLNAVNFYERGHWGGNLPISKWREPWNGIVENVFVLRLDEIHHIHIAIVCMTGEKEIHSDEGFNRLLNALKGIQFTSIDQM